MSSLYSAPAAADADLAVSGLQVFKKANQSPDVACVLPLPGSGVLDGEWFTVVATGYVESVEGTSIAVRLLSGDSLDPTKNEVLGVSGSADCPAGKRIPWSISARLLYITETGTVTGTVQSDMAGAYSGPVGLPTPIVDVPIGVEPVLSFTVGVEITADAPPVKEAPAPPTTTPTETGTTQWEVAESDTDIALTAKPTTVVVGSVFLIEDEYMTVTDISNADNPGVARGAFGSTVAAHAAGLPVTIWGTEPAYIPPPPLPGTPEPLAPVTKTAVHMLTFSIED